MSISVQFYLIPTIKNMSMGLMSYDRTSKKQNKKLSKRTNRDYYFICVEMHGVISVCLVSKP